MKKMSNLYKKAIVLLMGAILVAGLTGCTTKELCLYPGCDNERIDGTGACYKHGSNVSSSTYKSTGSSYSSSTYKDESKKESSSYNNQSNVSNSGSTKSSNSTKKYDTYDVYDYDDPDDFASDFAYDEFGEDSWEAYEYGYDEAYDYWMDEMGE